MNCPACGLALSNDPATEVCPRCSLEQALGGASELRESARSVEGYELLHRLGEGAMGVVWLARECRLDRLVALKLISNGANPLMSQRLLREGQAAARLQHPNIVAVHALGGSGPSTYLAMDFLEGGNLRELLDRRPMAPRAAAELAAKLAGALAHAHGAGILHRDIKPSNILLDLAAEPHLADFGLAGALEGRGDLTEPGQVAGTPAYLAPELLSGADRASPQSDIYALGIVLYESAAGRTPFEGGSTAEILRQIVQLPPIAPRILVPAIPRDLETIILRCLEKTPSLRYASAQALHDDLGRFLRGEPITARRVGPAGQALRWCRRKPGAATSLTLASVILLLLAVGGPVVAFRIDRSRKAADDAAATAGAITEFLQKDLLEQASPNHQPDREVRLRTVLDLAAAKVSVRFSKRPQVEAAIRQTLGETYFAIGDYQAARSQLERTLALREGGAPGGGSGGAENPETLLAIDALASTYFYEGRLAEAEQYFSRVVETGRRILGEENVITLRAMNNLGLVLAKAGRIPESERLISRAYNIHRRVLGAEDPETLVFMNNLATEYGINGKFPQMEALLRQILEIRRRVSGPDHPDTTTVVHNIAFARMMQSDPKGAETLYQEALAARKRVSGPEHLYTLTTMINLALVYNAEARFAEAEQLALETVTISRRTLGPEHPETLRFCAHLGTIYLAEGRWESAEDLLRPTLAKSTKLYTDDWRTEAIRTRLGEAVAGLGRFAEAEALLTAGFRGLERNAAHLPPAFPDELDEARRRLFQLYTSWGRPDEAEAWRLVASRGRVFTSLSK
jgi:tetratricopeptide (TPR) repeat protein